MKLALSRRLCGLLIGHKGQTVRDFIADSGASIRVQSLQELTPSDPERTITVSGARDQVLRAIALVLNTVRGLGGRVPAVCVRAVRHQWPDCTMSSSQPCTTGSTCSILTPSWNRPHYHPCCRPSL